MKTSNNFTTLLNINALYDLRLKHYMLTESSLEVDKYLNRIHDTIDTFEPDLQTAGITNILLPITNLTLENTLGQNENNKDKNGILLINTYPHMLTKETTESLPKAIHTLTQNNFTDIKIITEVPSLTLINAVDVIVDYNMFNFINTVTENIDNETVIKIIKNGTYLSKKFIAPMMVEDTSVIKDNKKVDEMFKTIAKEVSVVFPLSFLPTSFFCDKKLIKPSKF